MIDLKAPDTDIVRAWSALAATGKRTSVAAVQTELASRGVQMPIVEVSERMAVLRISGHAPNERDASEAS